MRRRPERETFPRTLPNHEEHVRTRNPGGPGARRSADDRRLGVPRRSRGAARDHAGSRDGEALPRRRHHPEAHRGRRRAGRRQGEAKTVLKRHRDAEEAQKSELQRLVEQKTKLEEEARLGVSYRDRLSAMVASQLGELTAEQKQAVEKLAGSDPLKVADALDVLRPTWARPAAPATTTAPGQPAAPVAPHAQAPANAATPAGAPPPNGHKTKWQEYDEMLRLRPSVAPYFYANNKQAIEASRPPPAAN
jgi:hypothetical protein